MNNIENSIRHLQSSIDKRSRKITTYHTFVSESLENYKFSLGENLFADAYKAELNLCKKYLAHEVSKQKTEKKMLAMMIYLKSHRYNQWFWTGNQLAKCLDNI